MLTLLTSASSSSFGPDPFPETLRKAMALETWNEKSNTRVELQDCPVLTDLPVSRSSPVDECRIVYAAIRQ
jgi:hypothetical protein